MSAHFQCQDPKHRPLVSLRFIRGTQATILGADRLECRTPNGNQNRTIEFARCLYLGFGSVFMVLGRCLAVGNSDPYGYIIVLRISSPAFVN